MGAQLREGDLMGISIRTLLSRRSRLQELVDSIDRSALAQPPADLRQFARKEVSHQKVHERRCERRYSLITNVVAVALDRRLRIAGEPFIALSSGMSISGIRLIHTQPSPSDFLFLQVEGQPIALLLNVLRSCPIGHRFEIAGRLTEVRMTTPRIVSPASLMPVGTAAAKVVAETPDGATSPPSSDELIQWDGMTAAMRILKCRS